MRMSWPVCLIVVVACSSEPYTVAPPSEPFGPKVVRAFVVDHGWHTGLVVPAAALNAAIPELELRFGEPAFYELGWGDKGFYQSQEITTSLTLRAMFWSSGSVVHVVALPSSPREWFPHSEVADLWLSKSQLGTLQQFVAGSMARVDGRLVPLAKGNYGDSQFYDGVGRYHLFNTCNKWTAKGLASAGFEIWPALRLTAGSVMSIVDGEADE